MTRATAIPYGAWEPDTAPLQAGTLVDALNVAPNAGGYGPLNDFMASANALATPILGGTVFSNTSASVFIYAASGQSVYVSNNSSAFTAVYTGSGISPLLRWRFARFIGKAIAVQPQIAPIGGDLGGTMTTLGGSPPPAKVVGVVGNFLVLGDLSDGVDGSRPTRIRWSGFRNSNAWGTSTATQADFNDMPDEGGAVQGIVGREFGTVFQRYSISRMTYVGSPVVFQFDVVEKKRGAISAGSIIEAGLVSAYIADDGFFLWDGTSSTPIGAQRVNEYFRKRLHTGAEERIVGTFDPLAATLSWAYPIDGSGILKERLIYSLTENRWSRSDLQASWFMSGFDIGYTLEQLNSFGSLDSLPFSLDDPKLLGGRARAVGFNTAGAYGPLTGSSLAASLETADWQAGPGVRAFVNAVRPQVDAMAVTCAVGARPQTINDALSYTNDAQLALDGRCPLRTSGRFMRFRTNVAAGQTWAHASGIEVHIAGEGRR